ASRSGPAVGRCSTCRPACTRSNSWRPTRPGPWSRRGPRRCCTATPRPHGSEDRAAPDETNGSSVRTGRNGGAEMGRVRVSLATLAVAVLVLGEAAFAGGQGGGRGPRSEATPNTDWPRWRGPNADGVAEGGKLALRWSKTENVLWAVKLPGWGTSSP